MPENDIESNNNNERQSYAFSLLSLLSYAGITSTQSNRLEENHQLQPDVENDSAPQTDVDIELGTRTKRRGKRERDNSTSQEESIPAESLHEQTRSVEDHADLAIEINEASIENDEQSTVAEQPENIGITRKIARKLQKGLESAHSIVNPRIESIYQEGKEPDEYRADSIKHEKREHTAYAGFLILSAASGIFSYNDRNISSAITSTSAATLDYYSKRERQKSVDNDNVALRQAAINRTPAMEEGMKKEIDPVTKEGDMNRRKARTMYAARDLTFIAAMQMVNKESITGIAITLPIAASFHAAAIVYELKGSEKYKERNRFRERLENDRKNDIEMGR